MLNWIVWNKTVFYLILCIALLGGVVEYTDCITIWWWGSSIAGALGNAEYPFIAICAQILSMGQIELNCVLMLNWIAWHGTVFVC